MGSYLLTIDTYGLPLTVLNDLPDSKAFPGRSSVSPPVRPGYGDNCFCERQQEKTTNCVAKATDVPANFYSLQTLMRIHLIFWYICN